MYRLFSRWLFSLSFLVVLFIGFSVDSFADDTLDTFVEQDGLVVKAYLRYVESDWGSPVFSLDDGLTHQLTCNREAERCFVRSPALANVSSSPVVGYVDYSYTFTFPMAQRLQVRQVHRSGSQSRESTAYYDVVVEEIATPLLWRTEQSSNRITFIIAGFVLICFLVILKRCCFD